MLNTILDGHVVATFFIERAIWRSIGAGEGVLASELIQSAVTLPHAAIVLRDGDVADLLATRVYLKPKVSLVKLYTLFWKFVTAVVLSTS